MALQEPAHEASDAQRIYESRLSRYYPEDPHNRRYAMGSLLIGGLIGLLIGWFVLGWWLFPVRYEVFPNEMAASAQADYVSAVADAYVARQDTAAGDLARYRLRAYVAEDSLGEALENSALFFERNSGPNVDAYPQPMEFNSAARINNIGMLAEALDVTIGRSGATSEVAAESGADSPSASTDGDAPVQGTQDADATAPPNRFLQFLAALALIAAGIWLIRYLIQRQARERAEAEPVVGREQYDAVHTDRHPDDRDVAGAAAAGYASADYADADARVGEQGFYDAGAEPPTTLAAEVDPQAYAEYGFASDREDEIETGVYRMPHEPPADAFDEDDGWLHDMDDLVEDSAVEPEPVPARAGQRVNREVIESFDLRYHAEEYGGDYDQSFSIQDADERTIGSCGMGVNLQDGTMRGDPNRVVALSVWLLDKTSPQQLGDHRRTLISEYVIDHEMEALYENQQADVGPPIVAQPGTSFTIEGLNLTLACRVLEAGYSDAPGSAGVFQHVRLAIDVVKPRKSSLT